ncbi:hypothetical protein, partial [Sphingomonas sp. EC-HK361]|uniref:hypothetical protein n=1 Tax=Sphingomonas sp. EC-HK361 TaxID=2038397 RepID=UPI0018FE3CF4
PPGNPPRGPRLRSILIIVALAFLIGLIAMAIAMRGPLGRWMMPATVTQTTQAQTTAQPATPQLPARAVQPAVDTNLLVTREAQLSAQIATLEARAAIITNDANAASGNAGRAEATLVTVAARRALDRGTPLGYIEDQLRSRFGATQPRATLMVIQAGRQPVTLQDLRDGLDAIGQQLVSGDSGFIGDLGRTLRNLVVLHKEGTPSPLPADRLARARRLIDAGHTEAALAEVSRMPGAARAGNWMTAARRYIAARQALDTLEGTALLGQATPAPQPAAAD